MIRREIKNGWIIITQKDHSILSGDIMNHWGNSSFSPPKPKDEVLFAVSEHDNGWAEWEENPQINPLNKYPKNFLEMNYKDQADIWKKSYLRYSKQYPYASSLIALHFDKFNSSVLKRNTDALLLKAEIKEFVLENLKLASTEEKSLSEEIINNLKFVQIGDIISLALCHGWRSTQIDEIPYSLNSSNKSIMLKSQDGFNYRMHPFPFSKNPITVSISVVKINKKTFKNNNEFIEVFKKSEKTNLKFTINN